MSGLIRSNRLVGGRRVSVRFRRELAIRAQGSEAVATALKRASDYIVSYTTGPRMGVVLNADPEDGRILRARFIPVAEAGCGPFVKVTVPARTVWPEAERDEEIVVEVNAAELTFEGQTTGQGERGCSDWVCFSGDSVSFLKAKVSVPKVRAGCYRVILNPVSVETCCLALGAIPMSKEALVTEATEQGYDLRDPALPVVALGKAQKVFFTPMEKEKNGVFTSGLGVIPSIFYTEDVDEPAVPQLHAMRREVYSLMRDVMKPTVTRTADWEEAWNAQMLGAAIPAKPMWPEAGEEDPEAVAASDENSG